MGPQPDLYAVLGLEPGADLAAVERAYKTLIKEHHPDRAGGNPERAAELNHAYRELRAALSLRDDVSMHPVITARVPGWSLALWLLVLALVAGLAAAILTYFGPREATRIVGMKDKSVIRAQRVDVMERPLDLAAINASALEAVRMSKVSDEMAMGARSNRCFQDYRTRPTIGSFDRCAAFDTAVVRLQDRDPLRDRGRFSEIAVTSRLWSAAAMLSSDYLATDARLRRLRFHIELLLAPDEPSSSDR